jgi:sugar-specific transcriptional regulator TrmB
MDEPVRWVTRAEAAEEPEIPLSTLDRMIRRGEVEIRREGRRVYVRIHGPEYLSDEELLRRAVIMEDELERTVRDLERSASELQRGASELEREREPRPERPHPPADRRIGRWRERTRRRPPSTRRCTRSVH